MNTSACRLLLATGLVVALTSCDNQNEPAGTSTSSAFRPSVTIAETGWSTSVSNEDDVPGIDYATISYVTREIVTGHALYYAIWTDMDRASAVVDGGPERENAHWILHFFGTMSGSNEGLQISFDAVGMPDGGEITIGKKTSAFVCGAVVVVSTTGSKTRVKVINPGILGDTREAIEQKIADLRSHPEIVDFFDKDDSESITE